MRSKTLLLVRTKLSSWALAVVEEQIGFQAVFN